MTNNEKLNFIKKYIADIKNKDIEHCNLIIDDNWGKKDVIVRLELTVKRKKSKKNYFDLKNYDIEVKE